MFAQTSYTQLKPHLKILQCLTIHCLWYSSNLMTNKTFRSLVICKLRLIYLLALKPCGNPKRGCSNLLNLVFRCGTWPYEWGTQ